MSKEVSAFQGGLPANPQDLIDGLQNVGKDLHTSKGIPFLRLLKNGAYAYGPESIEPEEGSQWAMNPASMQHGWACWGEGELIDEVMVPGNQPKPARSELQQHDEPWTEQVAFVLQCLNGEDAGVQVLYKGTSLGLRNATKALINEIVSQLQHDAAHPVPVIELDVDSYHHKRYGETFTPVLNIVDWMSYEGVPAAADEESEPDPEPEAPTPPPETSARSASGGRKKRASKKTGKAKNPRRRRRAAAE